MVDTDYSLFINVLIPGHGINIISFVALPRPHSRYYSIPGIPQGTICPSFPITVYVISSINKVNSYYILLGLLLYFLFGLLHAKSR